VAIRYDGEFFYLDLALDPAHVEGFVRGWLERIGEVDPEGGSAAWRVGGEVRGPRAGLGGAAGSVTVGLGREV